MSSIGDKIDNDQKVKKVIKALPKAWEGKAMTLKKLNDHEKIDFSRFNGNLKPHEMEVKVHEGREHQKKSSLPSRLLHPLQKKKNRWMKVRKNTLLCLLGKLGRCSTRMKG